MNIVYSFSALHAPRYPSLFVRKHPSDEAKCVIQRALDSSRDFCQVMSKVFA